jgi:amidohydrolase
MSMNVAELKNRAVAKIDALRDELIRISTEIHANPELAFQEFKACALLCHTLHEYGFQVERGIGGLETAFRAEAGVNNGGPTIAILAEYDALPEIGHACGHNLIATSALGAGIAVQSLIDRLPGQVVVIGTPAEEGGGGKIVLIERGIFNDVDAAMLVHPSSLNLVDGRSLASTRLKVEFVGKASHAAAAPEDGINALEAVILTFNNVNALRLHLRQDVRVHGIITHGGTVANIIPDYAAAVFSVRASKRDFADEILTRVIHCAEAAGKATGAQLNYTVKPGYDEMIPNQTMARVFADNWRTIGVAVHPHPMFEGTASTDMGNLSHVIPSVHPYVSIAETETPGHTLAFREASISARGHEGMLRAAKGMAMTTIDLLADESLMRQVKQEFAEYRKK